MINTKDIYHMVDSKIVPNGFWVLPLADKIKLVENELINYTLTKMPHIVNEEETHKIENLDSLLILADNELLEEEKDDFFTHYTHYLLKIIGSLQSYEVVWMVEDDEELIDEPIAIFNDYDKLQLLMTHMETPPLQVTRGILNVFKYELLKRNIDKRLTLKNNN